MSTLYIFKCSIKELLERILYSEMYFLNSVLYFMFTYIYCSYVLHRLLNHTKVIALNEQMFLNGMKSWIFIPIFLVKKLCINVTRLMWVLVGIFLFWNCNNARFMPHWTVDGISCRAMSQTMIIVECVLETEISDFGYILYLQSKKQRVCLIKIKYISCHFSSSFHSILEQRCKI